MQNSKGGGGLNAERRGTGSWPIRGVEMFMMEKFRFSLRY
jgi:hypothetical protein